MTNPKVTVIGSGYVGTVAAACLARIGHHVVGVECSSRALAHLAQGRAPFFEPGLDELLAEGIRGGKLHFTADPVEAVQESRFVFLCVGTPPGDDGMPDMTPMATVLRSVAPVLEPDHILISKSTVPAGSAQWIRSMVDDLVGGHRDRAPAVVSNPEFLREGQAVNDFMNPERIVLGGDDPVALDQVADLYGPIVTQAFPFSDPIPVLRTDTATAEMSKYAANAFLAAKISLTNELAHFCQLLGGDINAIGAVVGLDERIGPQFLDAGMGWGGSCLGKDLAALLAAGDDHGYHSPLLEAIRAVNDRQRLMALTYLREQLADLRNRHISLLGLAFKPGTDDTRDAPAVEIAQQLLAAGAEVTAYDPTARPPPELAGIRTAADAYRAAQDADAVVLATGWEEFATLDLRRLRRVMRGDVVFDGRNLLDPDAARLAGLTYQGVGRSPLPRVNAT